MENPDLATLVRRLGYEEDLPVVVDPGVIDPAAFLDELLGRRLPNRALPDAPQRIATDTSQKVPVRFGHTLRAYVETGRSVEGLVCIPLAIAGWLRYLVAVDDAGRAFEPSSDPRLAELQAHLADVTLGCTDATLVHAACRPILADKCLFGVDLYEWRSWPAPVRWPPPSHVTSAPRAMPGVTGTLGATALTRYEP